MSLHSMHSLILSQPAAEIRG